MSIKFFSDIGKKDVAIAGGKGCNLGELYNSRFNVPNGFVVATRAYKAFLESKELQQDMAEQLSKLDISDNKALEKISKELKRLIMDQEFMEELAKEITEAIKKLKGSRFAVRSSA